MVWLSKKDSNMDFKMYFKYQNVLYVQWVDTAPVYRDGRF